MIDAEQLVTEVIEPTLAEMGVGGAAATNLLLGTAAQESRLQYLRQLGGGPALGLWQMEPATYDDHWWSYLRPRPELRYAVVEAGGLKDDIPPVEALKFNLRYAAAMARVHYLRVPEPLPDPDDTPAMARYWKDHYNTHLGHGTVEQFINSWSLVAHARRQS